MFAEIHSTCQQTVTVTDNNQAPTITCPADVEQTAGPGNCYLNNVFIADPVINDNCAVTLVTWTYTDPDGDIHNSPATGINFASGQTFEVGTTTVYYTAADAAGNTATCDFDVTILDIVPPVFTFGCPDPISVDVDPGRCDAVVNVPLPEYEDPCKELVSITHNSPFSTNTNNANGKYPVGTTTIIWTITDASGNVNTCDQDIIVTDNIDPTITCPASTSENIAADQCSKTGITLSGLVYDDNCTPKTLTWDIEDPLGNITSSQATGINLVDGQTFLIGTSTITYTVYDAAGNSASCQFTVTILRLDIPQTVISCPADPAPEPTLPGDCDAYVTVPAPVINDPCPTTTYTFENDFNHTADASGIYPIGTTVVTWTITDNSGATNTTCTQNVVVTDNQAPVITKCPVAPRFCWMHHRCNYRACFLNRWQLPRMLNSQMQQTKVLLAIIVVLL